MLLLPLREGEERPILKEREAKRVLLIAARAPRGCQTLILTHTDGSMMHRLRLRHAPGGSIILDPRDAGTRMAVDLVTACERLGAGHKVTIGDAA